MSGAIIRVLLERGDEHWRPPLFPGSEEAAEAGCSCPIEQPWPGRLDFADDCPVHPLKPVLQ